MLNSKLEDLYKHIPVEAFMGKNHFTPITVEICKNNFLLYIPSLPRTLNIQQDSSDDILKINTDDIIVEEAKKIITPQLKEKLAAHFLKHDTLLKPTSWLMTPHLVNIYLRHIDNAIKDKGFDKVIEGRPHLEIIDKNGISTAKLKEEFIEQIFTNVEMFIKKTLREDKRIWKEFANWFLINLIVLAINKLKNDFTQESLEYIDREVWEGILSLYIYKNQTVFFERFSYLVVKYTRSMARRLMKSMDIFKRSVEELEIILGLKVIEENIQDEKISLNILESNKSHSLLWVGNCLLYHRIREVLSFKNFVVSEGGKWPTAELASGKLSAIVQLRPDPVEVEPYLSYTERSNWQERMNQEVMFMNDITADVMDVISSVWLKQASHSEAMAIVTADDFLRFRGLKPQKNGGGRRGGYKKEWRKDIAKHIEILANTWISVTSMDVNEKVTDKNGWRCKKAKWHGESKALVITSRFGHATRDGIDPYAWRVRPGDVFSKFLFKHGWQTALISQKALEYHPIDQQWEKRLTRYLAWQWRNRQSGGAYLVPFNIKTILNAINKEVTKYNPLRTKERLEKALDTLQRDNVITGWQYEHANEGIVGTKGWWKEWLIWKVIIEPPQEVIDQYKKIMIPVVKKREVLPMSDQTKTMEFGELIKQTRLKRGLSQMQAAEEIGVTQSTLSRVEIGKSMDYNTRKLLKKWLSENKK